MDSYHNVFDLSDSYTEHELKSAFINKVSNINKIISNKYEREIYINALRKIYILAKNKLSKQIISYNTMHTLPKHFIDFGNNVNTGFSRSYSSITRNGETVIDETKTLYKDGKHKTYKKSYKVDKDGNKITLS